MSYLAPYDLALAFARVGLILRAWCGRTDLERHGVRCVFSESLNRNTLGISQSAPTGHGFSAGCSSSPEAPETFRDPSFTFGLPATARSLLGDLITTIFPADCRVCDRLLLHAGRSPVCDACLARIVPQSAALCTRCGEALGMESARFAHQFSAVTEEAAQCTPCRLAPPQFERACAFGVYENELRELIHLLKYEGMSAVAHLLAPRLAHAIRSLDLTGKVAVVAVPLFPAKERQRGYNQAALLGDAALTVLRKHGGLPAQLTPAHSLLRRVRDTESQFALSAKGRRSNLKGAFTVADKAALAGETVLLVDDIYTTGATARECARVLKRAGATRVFVATLARAQPERAALWDFGETAVWT